MVLEPDFESPSRLAIPQVQNGSSSDGNPLWLLKVKLPKCRPNLFPGGLEMMSRQTDPSVLWCF